VEDHRSLRDRYLGSMLGLACGDAVGTSVEFLPRGSFPIVTDMLGGGPFHLLPGQWTDDTSMALCLAESLIKQQGFNPHDQMVRYVNWWQWGYLSSTGECFDIGNTVRTALQRFEQSGEPNSGSIEPNTAGNGSLMRLAPIALFYYPNRGAVVEHSAASSLTTHGAPEAVECCKLLGLVLCGCLSGNDRANILDVSAAEFSCHRVQEIAAGAYLRKAITEVRGSGYAVESLEAALWCFANTQTFKDAVLAATNLGDDADSTAAIVGQIAGAYYGVSEIPGEWLAKLHMRELIAAYAIELLDVASA